MTNIFYKTLLPLKRYIDQNLISNRRNRILLLILVLGVFYVSTRFKSLFFIIILTSIGSLSMIYLRYVPELYVLGVEFCMLATVTCAKAYGGAVGAFVGFTSITAATLLGGRFKPSSFISIFTLPLIGFGASYVPLPIQALGIVMTATYDAIILPLYYFTGSRLPSTIIFFISHMLFNYWAFTTVAPILLSLMLK